MEFQVQHEPMHVHSLDDNKWFVGVSPAARRHLLNSMKSLAAGRAPTISFKLYGKTDWSVVTDFFNLVKASGLKIPEWQIKYELSRKKKFGPQGGYAPWTELLPEFLLYYSNVKERNSIPTYDNILSKYEQMDCHCRSLSDTLDQLKHDDKILTRAAGWRNFNLKKTDVKAQIDALTDIHSGNWIRGYGYVFSRFNKLKKRLFFPMPFSSMILEAQYYYPFLKEIQHSLLAALDRSPFTFWADKIGFDKMFKLIVSPKTRNSDPSHFVFVQRDFYHMDTSQGFDQTRASFLPRIKKAFHLSEKVYNDYSKVLYFGATCPIFTPDGVYTGYRGKASGANTTNGDETCSNEDYDAHFQVILQSKCLNAKIEFELLYSGGNGDDGMCIYHLKDMRRLSTFKKLIQEAAEQAALDFGYTINDKWLVSNEYGLYCQRMLTSDDQGNIIDMYPASLILNSILNPEKQYSPADWDKDYRDWQIIEKLDNGKNLPYFHLLIDYVDNGMKFGLLGRSEVETRRILSKYDKYRATRDDPFNYQDPELFSNIHNSPTIQYLLAKRGYSLGK